MTEKIYTTRKNGMSVLLLTILVLLAGIALMVTGAVWLDRGVTAVGVCLFVPGILLICFGWIPFCGLKVIKPQEALVLTLFGQYKGTIREEGFYFVNPFCSAVNPAASTRLAQSGDTSAVHSAGRSASNTAAAAGETVSKKISLKAMTLNNGRQKINDCLGNPVEIGIAVIWRVTDTAKAVFNVDNYKEYLSLQCDSALRNIVRIYPYDVAQGVDTTGDGNADEGSLRGSA